MKSLFKIILIISLSASAFAFEKYSVHCKSYLLESSLDTAIAQIGLVESGNNRGEVEKYTDNIGLPKGSAYCAAGVYYCFDKAAHNTKDIPIPKTGVATAIFNYAAKTGQKVEAIPKKHDLIIWRLARTWRGHIERIYKTGKSGWVWTVGFNTKSNGREGVFRKKRNLHHILGRLKVLGLVGFSTEKAI